MKIYTKTGDKGETSLLSGERVPKYHERIEAYGLVDELNSLLGVVLSTLPKEVQDQQKIVQNVQHTLFIVGSHLSGYGNDSVLEKLPEINEDHITIFENAIDEMNNVLPPLNNFILPGGHVSAGYTHIARTICRKAERRIIKLGLSDGMIPVIIKYLNRLSDYFFVLARYINFKTDRPETKWLPK